MKRKFCNVPFDYVHLVPNGNVFLCNWMDGAIGNLLEEDLEDIWNGEKADTVRQSIIDGSYKYCRAVSCPYLENDSLPYMSEEEIEANAVKTDKPERFNVACDFTCNHSCPSCRDKVFVGDATYKQNLQTIIEKIMPYLNQAKSICTCGNGDVFSSPQMFSVLERLQPENDDIKITIETNGVLFDEEHWERIAHLAKYYMKVAITPNSFDPITFKYLNGGHNTYDKLIQSLYFVKELRQKEAINFFDITMVMQERNFLELPSFVERCLNDFLVDVVTIRPIYRWFCLSEDMYWYKDVLNPKHPYHKEYHEMMKAPILNDERVYFWGAKNLHKEQDHPAYRYKEYLGIVDKLLGMEDAEAKIKSFFEKYNTDSVYIYGDTELSKMICRILDKSISVNAFIARDTDKESICGKQVIRLGEYKSKEEDVVFVLNYHFFTNIKRDLEFAGFKGKLVRLDEFVDAL